MALAKEIAYDVRSIAPTRDINGKLLMGPLERGRREQLLKNVIARYQDFVARALPPVKDDSADSEKIRAELRDFEVAMLTKIKASRLYSQITITGLGGLLAGIGLLFPQYDIMEFIEGGRSENSLFASSVIYFSLFGTLALTKATTIASDSLRMLRDLQNLLKNPEAQLSRPWVGSQAWIDLKQRMFGLNTKPPLLLEPVPRSAAVCEKAFN